MNSIVIQNMSLHPDIPSREQFIDWVTAALHQSNAEITIRIVDIPDSTALNKTYRQKEGPTNVLSFPFTVVHDPNLLIGDIVICAPLVYSEAQQKQISVQAHWAHLTIHGVLHLQGFDHKQEEDAKLMTTQEITILNFFGIRNPYE